MPQIIVNDMAAGQGTPASQYRAAILLLDRCDELQEERGVRACGNKIHKINLASADTPATDVANIVHRLCAAVGMLEMVAALAESGEDAGDLISTIERLLLCAINGIDAATGFDPVEHRFDYMAGPFARAGK